MSRSKKEKREDKTRKKKGSTPRAVGAGHAAPDSAELAPLDLLLRLVDVHNALSKVEIRSLRTNKPTSPVSQLFPLLSSLTADGNMTSTNSSTDPSVSHHTPALLNEKMWVVVVHPLVRVTTLGEKEGKAQNRRRRKRTAFSCTPSTLMRDVCEYWFLRPRLKPKMEPFTYSLQYHPNRPS